MTTTTMLLTAWILCCLAPHTAQAQTPQWHKHYGEPDSMQNHGFVLIQGEPGHIYGVGGMAAPELDLDGNLGVAFGAQGVLVVKWDTVGTVQWVRTAGGPSPFEFEYAIGAVYDPLAGHLIVTGFFTGGEAQFGTHVIEGLGDLGQADAFVAAYDGMGECLWARAITGYYSGAPSAIRTDASSNIWAVGNAGVAGANFVGQGTVWVPQGGYLAHYNANGGLISAERVLVNGSISGMCPFGTDRIFSGQANSDASLFGAAIPITDTNTEGFVAKVNSNDEMIWLMGFPSSGDSQIWLAEVDGQGNTIVAGIFVDSLYLPADTLIGVDGMEDFFLASLDPAGEIQWVRSMHMPLYGTIKDMEITPDGDVYIQGSYEGVLIIGTHVLPSSTSRDAFVARFSADGVPLGAWNCGKVSYSQGSILPTESGFYLSLTYDSTLVIGNTVIPSNHNISGPGPGGDLLLAKFGELSGFTGVQAMAPAHGGGGLHIYANPNSGLCTVELPKALQVTPGLVLSVYDNTGQLVQRAPLQFSGNGVVLDIRAQARGVYHVELGDGQQRYTGTIVFE